MFHTSSNSARFTNLSVSPDHLLDKLLQRSQLLLVYEVEHLRHHKVRVLQVMLPCSSVE